MTSIIWYIYNEYLKREHQLREKVREEARKRLERIRDHEDSRDK